MQINEPWYAQLWAKIRPWVTGAFAVALLLSVVQCVQAERTARTASVQTFNLERVSAFQDSGRVMDEKVAALFDAAAEEAPLETQKREARAAIVSHASQVEALRGLLDPNLARDYMQRLVVLRGAVDATVDQTNAGTNTTALGKAVQARRALADEALQRLAD